MALRTETDMKEVTPVNTDKKDIRIIEYLKDEKHWTSEEILEFLVAIKSENPIKQIISATQDTK